MNTSIKSPLKQHLIASIISLSVLAIALLVLWLGHGFTQVIAPKVVIHEVSIATPPPPPPPSPTVQQPVIEMPITLQVQGNGPSIKISHHEQVLEIKQPVIPTFNTAHSQWQSLEIDWQAFELNDLDGLPTLLSSLKVNFPKSLTRKGIKTVLIKLEVMIDEQGHLTLIDIVENPYSELREVIQRLIRNTRFSAPTKDNLPVRARFIWPVEITA